MTPYLVLCKKLDKIANGVIAKYFSCVMQVHTLKKNMLCLHQVYYIAKQRKCKKTNDKKKHTKVEK